MSRSLVAMERENPGSCEAFVAKLIELLGRYTKLYIKTTDTNTCFVISDCVLLLLLDLMTP